MRRWESVQSFANPGLAPSITIACADAYILDQASSYLGWTAGAPRFYKRANDHDVDALLETSYSPSLVDTAIAQHGVKYLAKSSFRHDTRSSPRRHVAARQRRGSAGLSASAPDQVLKPLPIASPSCRPTTLLTDSTPGTLSVDDPRYPQSALLARDSNSCIGLKAQSDAAQRG